MLLCLKSLGNISKIGTEFFLIGIMEKMECGGEET